MSSTYYCKGCTAVARDGAICKNGFPTGSDHVHKWISKREAKSIMITKQRNMRSHVMKRNQRFWKAEADEYHCDICGRKVANPNHLINSHIVAHANAKRLHDARKTSKCLISSLSYDCNGLLLCGDCDDNFEDHNITIDGDGTIKLKDGVTFKPEGTYDALRDTRVQWAEEIGIDPSWPSAALLEFRKTLPPVVSQHRSFKFSVLADDRSTASSDEEEEDEIEEKGSDGVKLGKRPAKSMKGRAKKAPTKKYQIKKGRERVEPEPEDIGMLYCDIKHCRKRFHIWNLLLSLCLCVDHVNLQAVDIEGC